MKSLLAAMQFFSVFPVKSSFDSRTIGGALPFLPVVGIMIGAVVSAIIFCSNYMISTPSISAFVGVVGLIWLTGGLHLDGVADSFDGLWSARSKERVLEIMRDSRIGAMGVLGLLIVLGLKFVALSSLEFEYQLKAIFLAPIVARSVVVFVVFSVPYVRQEGMGKIFTDHKRVWHMLFAALLTISTSFYLLGTLFWIPLVFGVIGAALINIKAIRTIGGMTGDTAGASCEFAEAFVLLSFCVDLI